MRLLWSNNELQETRTTQNEVLEEGGLREKGYNIRTRKKPSQKKIKYSI
jgi:hypothetical protein